MTYQENRFHALKFALATPGVHPADVVNTADKYFRFLEGGAPAVLPSAGQILEANTNHPDYVNPYAEQLKQTIDHDTGREPADEMEAYPTVDVASEVIDPPEVLTADTPEEITEAVATLASSPPPEPDPSDAPELTTDECETYEDTVRAADRELETIWR